MEMGFPLLKGEDVADSAEMFFINKVGEREKQD